MVFGKCVRRFRASGYPGSSYAFHDQTLVVLHGFIKKTQKTPAGDLALAKRRMKEITK
jgi:phage-related protein